MRAYIVFFLVVPIFNAIEASAELLQPTIIATTVNAGIIASNISVIWRNGLLMLGVALMGIAGGVGACWFATKSSQGRADLRRAFGIVLQDSQLFSGECGRAYATDARKLPALMSKGPRSLHLPIRSYAECPKDTIPC